MNPMTCDEFDVLLPDVLEETIDAGSRAAAEGHLATCARCRSLLNDLKELQSEAARLPALSPSHDLWGGISARIETPAIELRDRRGAPGWWQQPRWLAVAASVLIALTASTTWMISQRVNAGDAAPAPGSLLPAPSEQVAAAYNADITKLTTLVSAHPPAVDSATARVLASSMRSIDSAIARVRTALDAAPANLALARQLAHAYDMKLNTLRLIASMQTE
jgi:hypothetical protein